MPGRVVSPAAATAASPSGALAVEPPTPNEEVNPIITTAFLSLLDNPTSLFLAAITDSESSKSTTLHTQLLREKEISLQSTLASVTKHLYDACKTIFSSHLSHGSNIVKKN